MLQSKGQRTQTSVSELGPAEVAAQLDRVNAHGVTAVRTCVREIVTDIDRTHLSSLLASAMRALMRWKQPAWTQERAS